MFICFIALQRIDDSVRIHKTCLFPQYHHWHITPIPFCKHKIRCPSVSSNQLEAHSARPVLLRGPVPQRPGARTTFFPVSSRARVRRSLALSGCRTRLLGSVQFSALRRRASRGSCSWPGLFSYLELPWPSASASVNNGGVRAATAQPVRRTRVSTAITRILRKLFIRIWRQFYLFRINC